MTRQSKESIAIHAKQLLEDELFNSAFDSLENEIISKIKSANIDGSETAADYVLELGRKLQTTEAIKRALRGRINSHSIQEYNERAKAK